MGLILDYLYLFAKIYHVFPNCFLFSSPLLVLISMFHPLMPLFSLLLHYQSQSNMSISCKMPIIKLSYTYLFTRNTENIHVQHFLSSHQKISYKNLIAFGFSYISMDCDKNSLFSPYSTQEVWNCLVSASPSAHHLIKISTQLS